MYANNENSTDQLISQKKKKKQNSVLFSQMAKLNRFHGGPAYNGPYGLTNPQIFDIQWTSLEVNGIDEDSSNMHLVTQQILSFLNSENNNAEMSSSLAFTNY